MERGSSFSLLEGESLAASGPVEFATGHYQRVRGFRSFRDFQRRDISSRLPGWPESRIPREPPAKGSAKGTALAGLWAGEQVLGIVVNALLSNDTAADQYDRPNECEDFPVLWADPGTVAFAAPWQLDPGRNAVQPRVLLHVTDRRLVFTDPASARVLWEIAPREVASTDLAGSDLRLRFHDDSWVRLKMPDDKYLKLRATVAAFVPAPPTSA